MTERILAGLVVFCILVPASLVAYGITARILHGPVTPGSLAESVAPHEQMAQGACRRTRKPDTWLCRLNDGASRSREVSVRVRPDSSCWKTGNGHEGCVRRWQ